MSENKICNDCFENPLLKFKCSVGKCSYCLLKEILNSPIEYNSKSSQINLCCKCLDTHHCYPISILTKLYKFIDYTNNKERRKLFS